jgi:hypothetical protein
MNLFIFYIQQQELKRKNKKKIWLWERRTIYLFTHINFERCKCQRFLAAAIDNKLIMRHHENIYLKR